MVSENTTNELAKSLTKTSVLYIFRTQNFDTPSIHADILYTHQCDENNADYEYTYYVLIIHQILKIIT